MTPSTTNTAARELADQLYAWLVGLMPNGDMLNAAVVCDIAGAANFKRSLAAKLATLTQQAAGEAVAWVNCEFHGEPPAGFDAWNLWAASPVLFGVTIRATTPPRHPADEGMAMDAARYRWLRHKMTCGSFTLTEELSVVGAKSPQSFDAVVDEHLRDAALQAGSP